MKKVVVLILFIMFPMLLFASDEYVKKVDLVFDLKSGSSPYYFDAGFTLSPETVRSTETPDKVESIDFNVSDGAYDGVAVYWVSKGGNNFELRLYTLGPMKKGEDSLDWRVSWVNGSSSEYIGDDSYGIENRCVVYNKNSTARVIDAGFVPILIEALPENMQRAGSYTASLVLEIETNA